MSIATHIFEECTVVPRNKVRPAFAVERQFPQDLLVHILVRAGGYRLFGHDEPAGYMPDLAHLATRALAEPAQVFQYVLAELVLCLLLARLCECALQARGAHHRLRIE